MGARVVALLRGVNVGGVRFAMRDLAAALEDDGFADVRTVLASGNVVLTVEGRESVAPRVAAVIRERFGFDVAVIAVGLPAVRTAVSGYPFVRSPDRHAYAVFGETAGALSELLASAPPDPAVERVAEGEGVLWWDCPKGRTLDTAFAKGYGRLQRSGAVTTRNLNTLEKILAGEEEGAVSRRR